MNDYAHSGDASTSACTHQATYNDNCSLNRTRRSTSDGKDRYCIDYKDNGDKIKNVSSRLSPTWHNFSAEPCFTAVKHANMRRKCRSGWRSVYFLSSIITLLFCIFAGARADQETTRADDTSPFLAEPDDSPYYLRERAPGPLIRCVVAEAFRSRDRYELEWMKIVGGFPITVARNSDLFDRHAYDLEESIREGAYNLRIKSVTLAHDNGNFFCALIDLENRRRQFHSKPARIVVVVPPEAPQIIDEPKTFVRENELVTIECASRGGNPPPRFVWIFDNETRAPDNWSHVRQEAPLKNESGKHSNGSGRTISTIKWHVKRDDNGAYLTCQIWNEALGDAETLSTETNRLNVHYAPHVTVGPATALSVEEGDAVELTCQADANPPAQRFEWRHVSAAVLAGANVDAAPLVAPSPADDRWRFVASRRHAGEFHCTAFNAEGASSSTIGSVTAIALNVLYAPRIRIRTVSGGVSNAIPSAVSPGSAEDEATRMGGATAVVEPVEAERFELDCDVDANPPADQISWLGPAGFVQNGSRLIIDKVDRSHVGNFTCVASNTLRGVYAPAAAAAVSAVTGAALNANIAPTLPGVEIRGAQASIRVDVRRRPGAATIRATSTSVQVGQRVALTCDTDDVGNPPAKYRWETPHGYNKLSAGIPKSSGSKEFELSATDDLGIGAGGGTHQLIIEEARLSDAGRYRCVAYNTFGQGREALHRLLVVEPARITRQPPAKRTLTAGDADAALHCEARGYPLPRIEWMKDGLPVGEHGSGGRSANRRTHFMVTDRETSVPSCADEDACVRTVVSSLHFFDTVEWSDKGNYTCRASNGAPAAPSPSAFTALSVVHEPVILNERFPDVALAAADVGTNARIVCSVSARPEPSFVWTRDGREIEDRDAPRYTVRSSRLYGRLDEYESTLELLGVTEADFGAYHCAARNGAGGRRAIVEFRLQAKSAPQTPRDIRRLTSGVTWIQIGWKPAFDGGDPQHFELELRDADPYTGKTATASAEQSSRVLRFDTHNSTLATFYELLEAEQLDGESYRKRRSTLNTAFVTGTAISTLPDTFMVYNVSGLRPLATLWYRVRAQNALGASDWTALASATTADAPATAAASGNAWAPVSAHYFYDERKLVIQPSKWSSTVGVGPGFVTPSLKGKTPKDASHPATPKWCVLVYVGAYSAADDERPSPSQQRYRSVDCFSVRSADMTAAITILEVQPAERYRIRFCRASSAKTGNDFSECSAPLDIFVDLSAISAMILPPAWETLALVAVGGLLALSALLAALLCCRRVLYGGGGNATANKTFVAALATQTSQLKKKQRKEAGGGMSAEKYSTAINNNGTLSHSGDIPVAAGGGTPLHKNTAVHGSQSDSGVFTLASSTNNNNVLRNATSGGNRQAESWQNSSASATSSAASDAAATNARHSVYDFSNDPFMQEFHNLHGIVALENGLAADELAGTRNSIHSGNAYALFNGASTNNLRRLSAPSVSALNVNTVAMNPDGDVGVAVNAAAVSSCEQLIIATDNSDSASYNGGVGGCSGSGGGGRVMREIIV